MELNCTRPGCPRPHNVFPDLANSKTVKTVNQKFCTACGMPLILAGRYLPQRLLGKGGFGAAYLAIDRFSPALRTCVVKIFQPDGDLSAQQMDLAQGLFEREAEALEQLGNAHPQIPDMLAFFPLQVPSMQAGKVQELFYLVQEYIDGQSLEEELEQKGPLSEADVREILLNVLRILTFVHDRDAIHRDIKPSNIMRDRKGKIYLLDFGAVKQVTQSAGKAANTSTGIYSPGYAPPEQMQGGAVYPATDLYALAVTVLVLLTGKEPTELYDSFSGQWDYQKHVSVSSGLAEVLEKMLQPTPRDRFASATATGAALTSVTSSSTPSAHPAASPSAQISPPTVPPPNRSVAPAPGTALQTPGPSSPQTSQSTPQPPPVAPPSPPTAPASPAASPPPAQPASQPAPPQPVAASSSKPTRVPFSLRELLVHSAFTGVQGSALAIAIASFGLTIAVGAGGWLLLLGGIVALQYRRVIEGADLWIIAGLSILLMVIIRPLTRILEGDLLTALVIIVVSGLVAVAVALLFQILFRLLRSLL